MRGRVRAIQRSLVEYFARIYDVAGLLFSKEEYPKKVHSYPKHRPLGRRLRIITRSFGCGTADFGSDLLPESSRN